MIFLLILLTLVDVLYFGYYFQDTNMFSFGFSLCQTNSILWIHSSFLYIQILFSLSSKRSRGCLQITEFTWKWYHLVVSSNASSVPYNVLKIFTSSTIKCDLVIRGLDSWKFRFNILAVNVKYIYIYLCVEVFLPWHVNNLMVILSFEVIGFHFM